MSLSSSISIAGIIQYEDGEHICYDTTYTTYEQALTHMSVDYSLVVVGKLVVDTVAHPIYQFIDLNKLINQYTVSITSWDELVTVISDHYQDADWEDVLTYCAVPKKQYFRVTIENPYTISSVTKSRPTPFKSNLNDRPNIFSLHHSSLLTGSYLNKKAPLIRNKPGRIRQMPDLVFTKTDNSPVSLEHTIASIDGNVGMPEYSAQTDELYIKNGAHFLRGTDNIDQNITFIDFKDMCLSGTTVKSTYFSDCSPDLIIQKGDEIVLYSNYDGVVNTLLTRNILFWKQSIVKLKFAVEIDEVEGCNYIPLICFGGRLFFPGIDDIDYYPLHSGDKDYLVIEFNVDTDLLVRIVAANLQHAGIFLGLSSIYQVAISYLVSNVFTTKEYNIQHSSEEWRAIEYVRKSDIPFVSVITTDRPYVFQRIDPIYPMHDGELKFPAGSRGLLISGLTREIHDYTRIDYDSCTIVATTPVKPLFVSKTEGAVPHLNTTDTRIAQAINIGANVHSFFPPDSIIRFSTSAGWRYVVRSKENYVLYAQSNVDPYERTTNGSSAEFSWSDVTALGTPDVEFDAVAQSAVATVGEVQFVAKEAYNTNGTPKATSALTWYKVLPVTDRTITWYIYESLIEIPDGMRYNNSIWQKDPVLYSGIHNRFYPSTQIKDTRQHFLLDIQYAGATSQLTEKVEIPEEDGHPEDPVVTIEYQTIKDKLREVKPDDNREVRVSMTFTVNNGVYQPTDTELEVEYLDNSEYNGRYQKLPNGTTWGFSQVEHGAMIKWIDTRWVLFIQAWVDPATGTQHDAVVLAVSDELPTDVDLGPYEPTVIWRNVHA